MRLWPHQTAAIATARGAIDAGCSAGLWAMPTGTGKTGAFVSLAAECGWPTLVLVHRDELIQQTRETCAQVWLDAAVGVVQAERDEWDSTPDGARPDVVVATVPSLHARRLARIPRDRFGLIVAGEAHHAVAPSCAAVLDHFDADFLLGCTATPERADGCGLAARFAKRVLYQATRYVALEAEAVIQVAGERPPAEAVA